MNLGLDASLAGRIVARIMELLDYNINIMDEKGIIIASGTQSRIGQLHKDAQEVIKTGKTREIFVDTPTEKRGVNKPIHVERRIIGVIGISGDPNEVRRFADLIAITAQLMIEQQFYSNVEEVKQTRFRDFLNEWINKSDTNYDEGFKLRAELLKVELFNPRIVALLKMDKLRYNAHEFYKKFLYANEYIMRYGLQNILIILDATGKYKEKLQMISNNDSLLISISASRPHLLLSTALKEAENLSSILDSAITDEIIGYYEDYQLIDCVLQSDVKEELLVHIQDIIDVDKKKELIETIDAYFKCNGEMKAVANKLYIHRNTLSYRLKKIESITNRSFHNYQDLLYIYFALLSYQHQTRGNKAL